MSHVLPTEIDLGVLDPRCMPGQYGTQADYQYPVVLSSPTGAFGANVGTISLISNTTSDSEPMEVCAGAAWTPVTIAAWFPGENPGTDDPNESYRIIVHGDGPDQEISPVYVTGPDGSGWPPTHSPVGSQNYEPVPR